MKKFLKVLVLTLALWQALFSTSVSVALAQEISDSPTPSPTPDAVITTGDAVSETTSLAETNISQVVETPTPTPTPTPTDSPLDLSSPVATDSATPEIIVTPTPTPDSISIDQSATVTSDSSAGSTTGENNQTTSESAQMTTGNAASTANNINVTNLAEVNSNLITTVQTIYSGDAGNVDVYQLLINAIAENPNFIPGNTDITASQSADVAAITSASANSGENNQSTGSASMQTGNAVSLSNAINAVNLNLIGSNTVLAIINILGDYSGNIILPNGQTFSLASLGLGNVNVTSNQIADVSTTTDANSNTGDNTQTGRNIDITTGNAGSVGNTASFVNLVQIGGGLGYLVINNSGNWTGSLINWTTPGSVETLPQGTTNLLSNWEGGTGGNGTTNITSNQTAGVSTNVSANSNTGENSQTGRNLNLTTGNAFSLANNLTLANITGVGAGFLFGIINIFGNWTGNIISGPYVKDVSNTAPDSAPTEAAGPTTDPPADTRTPDLQIAVNNNVGDFIYPGDTILANIIVTNQSAFIAHNVEVKGQLTNDHPMPAIPLSWKIGELRPNGKAKISFSITLTSDLPEGQYKIAVTATGDSDSGNVASTGGASSFWVKVKGVITELTAPIALAESTTNAGSSEVLGITSNKSPLDLNNYLPYILVALAAAYFFIFLARKKLKEENDQD